MIELPRELTKLSELMRKVEAERSPFTLFALLLREDSPGAWDLVVAAPWLEEGKLKALGEFAKEISDFFGVEHIGLLSLSGIVTLNKDTPALRTILADVAPVSRPVERHGRNLFGLPVEQAYILKAKRPIRGHDVAVSAAQTNGSDHRRGHRTRVSYR